MRQRSEMGQCDSKNPKNCLMLAGQERLLWRSDAYTDVWMAQSTKTKAEIFPGWFYWTIVLDKDQVSGKYWDGF